MPNITLNVNQNKTFKDDSCANNKFGHFLTHSHGIFLSFYQLTFRIFAVAAPN